MNLPLLSPYQWTLALLAALCVGLAKSGLAGFGMLPVLLMAEIMPARESTGALLPMLICGDVLAVAIFRRHAQWRYILRLLPPACLGIVAGYFLMEKIPGSVFRPIIGWIVLLLAGLHLWRKRNPSTFRHVPHSRWFAWLMGGISGVTTMIANAAGPVMAIYLLALDLPKFEFVGTGAWFFLVINLLKVPFSARLGLISPHSIALNIVLFPVVACGIWAGSKLVKIIPQILFEAIALVFAVAAAIRFIVF